MNRFFLAAWAASLLPGMVGCARSMEDDLADLRAEIVTLEKKRIVEDSSIWIHNGPTSFDKLVEDGDDRIPDFIYYHVVRRLKAARAEDLQTSAGTDFDWDRCMDLPAAYRGKLCRVSGVVTRISVEKITDSDSPVPQIYSGVFYVEGKYPVFFHLIEKPDVLRLKEDVVEIDGIFFKILGARGASGKTVSAPFFVAKSMRKFM